jgi:D-serine deaminase-like pyridoxal phosphate-dependent protein
MSADMAADWYRVANIAEIASPALLVYPDRVEENTRRMVALAGSADRLRPHVKTHKLAEVVRLQGRHGITKFKCATIAEAEMTAAAGAPDVLIAYPLVGPNILRFVELIRTFPATQFRAIADDADAIRALSAAAVEFLPGRTSIEVLLDIDCGMHRTGVAPGPAAAALYRLLASLPGLLPGGLHAYDGHIADSDVEVRERRVEEAFAPVRAFRDALLQEGLPVPRLLASSTPTFPIHAKHADVECTPGTSAFWDWGYQVKCPDLGFLHAALVLTRVISKPGENRLCLDLGHKAIAAENPHPRVYFPDLPDAVAVGQSEEHLVVETPRATEFAVGTPLYGIPWHICPTVALYAEAVTVTEGRAAGRWQIAARARKLTT